MSEANKTVVRKVEGAWDANDLDALDQHFAADFDNSASAVPMLPPGLPGAKAAHQLSMKGLPDRKVEIVQMVAEGDTVVVRCRMTGTNTGGMEWLGAPANGARVDVPWVSIYELKDGKIVRHWGLNDVTTLMQQLGVLPAPGAATAGA